MAQQPPKLVVSDLAILYAELIEKSDNPVAEALDIGFRIGQMTKGPLAFSLLYSNEVMRVQGELARVRRRPGFLKKAGDNSAHLALVALIRHQMKGKK